MAAEPVGDPQVLQILALRLDAPWRREPAERRETEAAAWARAVRGAGDDMSTTTYSMIGLRAEAEVLLVRIGPTLERLEETAAELLRHGLGRAMRVAHSFVGLIRPSRYVKRPGAQEQALLEGERSRYLIVYPFTKTPEWYRLSRDARQGMMNEHIRIGHDFPQVRQLLAHSTGLDDQEFIVAYETDDLAAFQDLVIALRDTEARRYTLRDAPILTAIQRPLDELLALLA